MAGGQLSSCCGRIKWVASVKEFSHSILFIQQRQAGISQAQRIIIPLYTNGQRADESWPAADAAGQCSSWLIPFHFGAEYGCGMEKCRLADLIYMKWCIYDVLNISGKEMHSLFCVAKSHGFWSLVLLLEIMNVFITRQVLEFS